MERYRFPATRHVLTRKINCGGDLYLTVNPLPDGEPGEVFVTIGKGGSTLSGLMHAWAITISAALQRGVPWPELREKFEGTVCEPRNHKYSSLIDAVAQNVDEMIADLREAHGRKVEQTDAYDPA